MRRNADDDEPFAGGFPGGVPFGNPVTDETSDRVDIHEYDDQVTVVAELPAVDEDDIDLQCDGRTLAIRVAADTQPLLVKVDLPTYVDAGSMETTLNNGILEITLTTDRDPADIGFR